MRMTFAFRSRRSPVYATGGAVATSQPLATEAGVWTLRRGGNAADAALAAAAVLAVTEPTSCGIGGDCFALYYEAATAKVCALNGSGRAPAGLSVDAVRAAGLTALPPYHALTVTVPGAVAAWADLSTRFGTRPLGDVFAPAIRLADEGFPVAPITAYFWALEAEHKLRSSPGGHQLLLGGRAPAAGERIRNGALADVLRRIAAGGPDAFYRGPIAAAIARAVRDAGGVLGEEDLADHRSAWVDPIATRYRDVVVHECPPNGQGLVALLALNILRHRGVADLEPLGADRLHEVIEALRLAFADARACVADPDVASAPIAELLDDAYARARAAQIDRARATVDVQAGSPIGGSDTVYLAAVDGDGNACSLIFSNYMGFGTGIVPDRLGFSLQNRGHGFSLDPTHPNALAPGKRPYHTIIPAMATRAGDGSLYACFGVMGGFMQPQGHVQVLLALVDDGDDPQAALDRPRVCVRGGDAAGAVAVEDGIAPDVVAELARRGHDVQVVAGHQRALFGRGQVIVFDPDGDVLCAGSDPRADGCALGL
ncbi:MAG: gamma-glutamyltransferase family protein [Deltaproteobacteria bacterium]|nr:MAG: gamma-glutamyltransferase family protein [Deltaproteobacteria bacterium]